ncbi:MAG TPA: TonB-dependent receptor [Steroidobacteraceae bacterium]|nr:TonB-dependent receptor [Steroidobacteraceae bacterium]
MTCKVSTAVRRALLLGLAAGAVHAQEQAPAAPGAKVEEIVVTGSRLLRTRDFQAVSPVQTIDLEQIQASGNITLEDTLNKFPQLKPDNTGTTNQSGGTGVLSANLRGLGAVRTLVLVDGRRFVPADVTGLVDLATIPDVLVERVEILTGGASAVYGSDAIAGAVNFILRDDFDGAELTAQYGETSRGDGENYKIDAVFGTNTEDGRGNVTLHGSYTKRDPVFFTDRAFSSQPLLSDANGVLQPFGVGTIPGGLIGVSAADLARIQGVDLTNANGACPGPIQGVRFGNGSVPAPFCRPIDQFNYAKGNYLLRPLERWQITTTGKYDITDKVEAYAQLFYTKKENAFQQAPEALNPSSPGQESGTLLIPNANTNPLFTQALRNFFGANAAFFDPDGDGMYTVRNVSWQIAEFGPRNTTTISDSYNLTAGLRGDLTIGDSPWRWDTFYQFARADVIVNQIGRLSRTRLQLGLDAVVDGGTVRCRVNLLNCVPVSIFGTDALTPQMVNFLRVGTGRQDKFERQVAGGSLAGDVFDLPAGPISTAVGFEWRKEYFSTVPDVTALSGDLGTPTIPIINSGDFDISEVFAEVRVPVLKDLPAIHSLALEGAARRADYSTIGEVTTWKAGLDWAITDWVRVRAGLSSAIRAPNLNELLSGPTAGFVGGSDPCVATNNPTEAQKDLCVAQGVPVALRNTLQVGASQGFTVTSGGNPNLKEEESDTTTIGLVLQPPFAPRLSIAIDYFDITVDDAIAQVSGQQLINSCFQTLDAGGPACSAISRLTSGNIDVVRAPLLNVATRAVNGVDLQASYGMNMPSFLSLPGQSADLNLSLSATWQSEDSTVLLAGQREIDCAGYYGGTCSGDSIRITPDFRALLRAVWSSGPLSITTEVSHIGDLKLLPGAPKNQNNTLSARYYTDLTGTYRIGDSSRITVGITNLFDKQPPILGYPDGGDAGTNVQLFDVLGRQYFVGFTVGVGH